MNVERDIVGFSIPFSFGIAAGVLIPVGLKVIFPLASLLLALVGISLYLYIRLDRECIVLMTSLLLGFLCGLCSHLGTGVDFSRFEAAYEGFLAAIRGLKFEDENVSALATALLTGNRENLSPEIIADFRDAGASHILALSGFHFGIIYAIVSRALFWMNYNTALYRLKSLIIIAFSVFYTLMTGASPSLVRALLFVCLSEILKLSPGRKRRNSSVFCAALMVQLLLNPSVILSLGFQLSYLAMLGIVVLYPRLNSFYGEGTGVRVWGILSLSISCQAATAPLVWIRFRSFPFYFLITNLLALPLVSIFISLVILCLSLNLLGLCPLIIKSLTEIIGQALIKLLEIIALL